MKLKDMVVKMSKEKEKCKVYIDLTVGCVSVEADDVEVARNVAESIISKMSPRGRYNHEFR